MGPQLWESQCRQTSLSLGTREGALLTPHPWTGASLLISGFFAVLDEGNGFRSKAVGHFVCSQGDPENILMVSVVILGDRNSVFEDETRRRGTFWLRRGSDGEKACSSSMTRHKDAQSCSGILKSQRF